MLTLPHERNIHLFTALEENSSFIDIMIPNYDHQFRRLDFYEEKQPEAKVGEKTEIYMSYPKEDFGKRFVEYKGDQAE